jgi:arsenate reductase-like glutaredoxin family protein
MQVYMQKVRINNGISHDEINARENKIKDDVLRDMCSIEQLDWDQVFHTEQILVD